MNAPLIGITMYGRNEHRHFSLPAEYVECVRRAGGIPVLMPPGEPNLDDWFETVDALIIAGGADIQPSLYQGDSHPTIAGVDPERDHDEVALVHQAIEAELPTLCVCRGMQLLNVALGGDLFAHIPDCLSDAIPHRVEAGVDGATRPQPLGHEIVLDPGSRLATVMGEHRFDAVSLHHQAVDELAAGLVAVGHAPDRIVEAVELPEHPWLLAVQWHPELSAAVDPVQQRIFDALVSVACGDQ